ncbi:hypothetical protein R3P38DRAFT_2758786 [Favolaschia claudopus]|uniref:Uncharacterized protein n=1 Tax=Favolaschia claudopus TaxID=2862362 RepID=A0AAW0E7V6_9AGAR
MSQDFCPREYIHACCTGERRGTGWNPDEETGRGSRGNEWPRRMEHGDWAVNIELLRVRLPAAQELDLLLSVPCLCSSEGSSTAETVAGELTLAIPALRRQLSSAERAKKRERGAPVEVTNSGAYGETA